MNRSNTKTKLHLSGGLISVYKKTPWICGFEETNTFFCFVCLLFGGDNKCTEESVCDLKNPRRA
jgi:hypothetical protein